ELVVPLRRGGHCSAHVCPKPSQSLGEALDNDVGTEFQGTLAVGRGEGVVHDHQNSVKLPAPCIHLVGKAAEHPNVNQFHGGIGWSLKIEDAGGGGYLISQRIE